MLKHLLLFIIPAVVFTAVVIGVRLDKTPEVVHVSEGNGFAEAYTVTASPSFRWQHTSHSWMIVTGFVCFALVAGYSIYCDKEVRDVSISAIALTYIAGAIFILGPYSFNYYRMQTFQKTITAEQYEATKDSLDINFK